MSDHLKPPESAPAGQKVRPETAKRSDTSEDPNVVRPWKPDVNQGAVAPADRRRIPSRVHEASKPASPAVTGLAAD